MQGLLGCHSGKDCHQCIGVFCCLQYSIKANPPQQDLLCGHGICKVPYFGNGQGYVEACNEVPSQLGQICEAPNIKISHLQPAESGSTCHSVAPGHASAGAEGAGMGVCMLSSVMCCILDMNRCTQQHW